MIIFKSNKKINNLCNHVCIRHQYRFTIVQVCWGKWLVVLLRDRWQPWCGLPLWWEAVRGRPISDCSLVPPNIEMVSKPHQFMQQIPPPTSFQHTKQNNNEMRNMRWRFYWLEISVLHCHWSVRVLCRLVQSVCNGGISQSWTQLLRSAT
jgi:hypothetical protein